MKYLPSRSATAKLTRKKFVMFFRVLLLRHTMSRIRKFPTRANTNIMTYMEMRAIFSGWS